MRDFELCDREIDIIRRIGGIVRTYLVTADLCDWVIADKDSRFEEMDDTYSFRASWCMACLKMSGVQRFIVANSVGYQMF